MPLQQLVEYFNDRLEQEHNSGFRPFVLRDGRVEASFGPIRLASRLKPIRETLRSARRVGHMAQLQISANPAPTPPPAAVDALLNPEPPPQSIVNFDRLSRAVHMLNYLPEAHLDELLFLDVDPRHILGVKTDHGAYFEEVIVKCGLQTRNVAIVMTVNRIYARYYQTLLKGLQNYQTRGYRVALKFDCPMLDQAALDLLARAAADFVCLSAGELERIRDSRLLEKLRQLNGLVESIGGRGILLDIADKQNAALARQTGFGLVEGEYFDAAADSAPVYARSA
ncbi:hypothetical protein BJL95_17055 [Methylomonas sp. LWB]|uniref:hypothetical protein n=1 Tax=Methylomonas sp. LWB TaxID=1905845 RepID=UPI0008DA221A|nr:hypothetical protein [Methylomonas sp. LWB]OHX34381.1 hypothetical protein BJL95_17055 [Methylomonas sp. LWB]